MDHLPRLGLTTPQAFPVSSCCWRLHSPCSQLPPDTMQHGLHARDSCSVSFACRNWMQMIQDSARIARANGNRARASEARHISAAKPQAFVNEWRAPQRRFEALILTAPRVTDADCNNRRETLYTAAFE